MHDNDEVVNHKSKKVWLNLYISIVAFFELIAAGLFVLLPAPDPKNAWLLGYSKLRWELLLFAVLAGICVLISGFILFTRNLTISDFINQKVNQAGQRILAIVSFLFILWGWCSVFCPSYLFGIAGSYYERVQPVSIAIGIILLQFYLLDLFSRRSIDLPSLKERFNQEPIFRSSLLIAVCLISLFAFIGISKIGLIKDTPYWNVPGIPLSGLQYLAIIVIISLGMFFIPTEKQLLQSSWLGKASKLIPLIIYIGAVLVWGLTPMLKHYFSLEPTPPNYQPFPFSDARIYDSTSIVILNDQSNVFHTSTDKPLYIVFLAILHIIAGFDYSLLTWLQILVLGLIPVILFFVGRQVHSRAFGIYLAIIAIIQQRNAIVLSYLIASVNPKLLVTELMVLLGVVLLVYLVFKWLRSQEYWLALLAGGVVGAVSLIRLNPIFLFPTIALVALISLWKFPKTRWKQVAIFTLGFSIMFTPWLFTGVSPRTGIPWALEKPLSVISNRYLVKPVPTATSEPAGLVYSPTAVHPTTATAQPTKIITPKPSATPGTDKTATSAVTRVPVSPSPIPPGAGQIQETRTVTPNPSVTASTGITPTIAATSMPTSPNIPNKAGFLSALKRLFQVTLAAKQPQAEGETRNSFLDLFFSHFLHNFSTSLLSLPDSYIYDDLYHLAQRDYWIDFNPWSGNFPFGQVILILLNLVLIALGLGYSWQKYHWIGLVPLTIFVGYNVALSLVVNSGSRYIVPIGWILYYYHGLAVVLIIKEIGIFVHGEKRAITSYNQNKPSQSSRERKHFWYTLGGLALAACLIPLTHQGIKTPLGSALPAQNVAQFIQTIGVDQVKGAEISYGRILYPYYTKEGTLDFDFLVDRKPVHHLIDLTNHPITVKLYGGESALLVTRPENQGRVVDTIYLIYGNSIMQVWKNKSEN